jgi:hypothetical protein
MFSTPILPPEPESLEQTGLSESTVEQLLLKIMYFRGDIYGQDLSAAIGLKFSVIQGLMEMLKLSYHVQVKRSLGMGSVGAVYALTESGRARAREYLEANQYYGPAPVPLAQYADMVRRQKPVDGWLTKAGLRKAFQNLVLTERTLSQIGPAVSSANSLLLYGKPGDGKTFLIESLAKLDSAPIFLPHAIECQGNIVLVYDPIYHHRIEEEPRSVTAIAVENSYDTRWVKCKRPFIVSGGELTLEMLDLRFNHTSKIYEAPFQVKANNGMYLIDDFGRQRATPAEVLNRWIVPMERRVDYLSFVTGGKMTVPFESFLVFSTNLNPADLGDEAFLRRIQYKMLLHGPSENEFFRIFEAFCAARSLPFCRELVQRFVDRHFKVKGKLFRRCHPRDILSHALNLMHFEKLPFALTEEILDRAFDSCFVEESASPVEDSPLLPVQTQSCAQYWADEIARIDSAFGRLAFAAGYRDIGTDRYYDKRSAGLYGEAETGRVLQRLHAQVYRGWLALGLDNRVRDLHQHLAGVDRLEMVREGYLKQLTPSDSKDEEACLFAHDMAMAMGILSRKVENERVSDLMLVPAPQQQWITAQ